MTLREHKYMKGNSKTLSDISSISTAEIKSINHSEGQVERFLIQEPNASRTKLYLTPAHTPGPTQGLGVHLRSIQGAGFTSSVENSATVTRFPVVVLKPLRKRKQSTV